MQIPIDLFKASRESVTIAHLLNFYRDGILTYDEAVLAMIEELAKEYEAQWSDLLEKVIVTDRLQNALAFCPQAVVNSLSMDPVQKVLFLWEMIKQIQAMRLNAHRASQPRAIALKGRNESGGLT